MVVCFINTVVKPSVTSLGLRV